LSKINDTINSTGDFSRLEIIDGSNTVFNFSSGSNYFANIDLSSIMITENIILEKNKNNFLIVNNGKEVITWDENHDCWSILKINSFKGNFKENLKNKELGFSNTKSYILSNNILNLIYYIIEKDGNYYINLDKKLYYKFSKNSWVGLDLLGDFKLEIEKFVNIDFLKKNNKSKLLLEKIPKPIKLKGFALDAGYIFAPYVPAQTIQNNIIIEDYNPRKRLTSRYATNLVNSKYYTTATI
jgi:hypothetical protein